MCSHTYTGTDNLGTPAGQIQMLGAAFYILFGMAIISMCFNLIQEEIVGKFHWIAEKMGVARHTEDDEVTSGGDDNGGLATSPTGDQGEGVTNDYVIKSPDDGNSSDGTTRRRTLTNEIERDKKEREDDNDRSKRGALFFRRKPPTSAVEKQTLAPPPSTVL